MQKCEKNPYLTNKSRLTPAGSKPNHYHRCLMSTSFTPLTTRKFESCHMLGVEMMSNSSDIRKTWIMKCFDVLDGITGCVIFGICMAFYTPKGISCQETGRFSTTTKNAMVYPWYCPCALPTVVGENRFHCASYSNILPRMLDTNVIKCFPPLSIQYILSQHHISGDRFSHRTGFCLCNCCTAIFVQAVNKAHNILNLVFPSD